MEEELIDNELNESPKDVILAIIRWWEKKRLLFNLIILGVVILVVTVHLIGSQYSSWHFLSYPFFIQSVFYFIFINICYCAGWGIQLLGYYYLKIQYDSNALDYVLFIVGTLFTGLVTYAGYQEYLMYY